jgi:hypothetical protein
MSRTYRRRGERHAYDWVLRDCRWVNGVLTPFCIDARSKEGRRALARFHSDAYWSLRSTGPLPKRPKVIDLCPGLRSARHERCDGRAARAVSVP